MDIYINSYGRQYNTQWYSAYTIAAYDGQVLRKQVVRALEATPNAADIVAVAEALHLFNGCDCTIHIQSPYVAQGIKNTPKTNYRAWALVNRLYCGETIDTEKNEKMKDLKGVAKKHLTQIMKGHIYESKK